MRRTQLLGKRIFDALDMPLDTEVDEIEKKLNEFIRFHSYLRSMILLVDMGSLEGIAEHLDCPMEVGVINNISTGLALDIGMRLSRCEPLEMIFEISVRELSMPVPDSGAQAKRTGDSLYQ